MEDKKNLELERLIFFSDAVVSIAITLLALGIKINVADENHITFANLLQPWRKYLAFLLSFINIAGFWQTHHTIFSLTRKLDRTMFVMNLTWLFFIVILPFTTSIISAHFSDTPAIFLYSLNIFLLSVMQKLLWDHGDDTVSESYSVEKLQQIDVMFTLNLSNGIVAIIVSFFSPLVAFIILFFQIPLLVVASLYTAAKKRKSNVKAD